MPYNNILLDVLSGGIASKAGVDPKSGKGGPTAAATMSGNFASQIAKMSGPSRKMYFGQLKEALTTGSIGARTPIIQQQVEAGLSEGSRAQDVAAASLSQLGSAGARGPVAAEIKAGLSAQAARAVAAIPSEVVGQQALRGPADVLSASDAAMRLLGTAGMAQNQAQQAQAAADANTASTVGAGVGVGVAIIAAI